MLSARHPSLHGVVFKFARRAGGAAWLAFFLPGPFSVGLFAADEASRPTPLELPSFRVAGEFPADGWLYARRGSTEFASQLSAKRTQHLSEEFIVFQEFVRSHFPDFAPAEDHPTTIVLCSAAESYRRFGGNPSTRSSLLPGSPRFILIDDSQLDARNDDEHISTLLRRRWLGFGVRASAQPPPPLWREWAVRDLLIALHITANRVEFGYPPGAPHSEGGKKVQAVGYGSRGLVPDYSLQFNLPREALLPLADLFTLTRQSANLDQLAFPASRQATAFTHLCLFSVRHRHLREPYTTLVTRLQTEPFSEQLFFDCFNKSTTELGWVLRDYLFGSSMKYESHRFKISPTEPLVPRAAHPTEVLRLLRTCEQLQPAPTVSEKSR